MLLLVLVLGVLPSSGIIIIPRRYRRRRRPISSSARLFREIVRRRVFSLHRMIRVPHLFFFFGIGRILSMKCLQPLRLLLSIAAAALNFCAENFLSFVVQKKKKKKKKKTKGLTRRTRARRSRSSLSLSLCVCVCVCVFLFFSFSTLSSLCLTLCFAAPSSKNLPRIVRKLRAPALLP